MATPKLFPYSLLRVAGGPITDLQRTDLQRTRVIIDAIFSEIEKIEALQERLTDALYAYIAVAPTAAIRTLAVKLKRDIHNGRSVDHHLLERHEFPTKLSHLLEAYQRHQTKITALKKEGEQQYQNEMLQNKQEFANLLLRPNLQNGLLLSSNTIMDSLKKYLQTSGNVSMTVTKKERSFMEYLSRMYTKPTPFGTFTQLAIAIFSNEPGAAVVLPKEALPVETYIRLNHDLYEYITGFMMQHPQIRKLLPLALNFTIRKSGDQFVFLANDRNREAFQSTEITPSLELLHILVSKATRPPSYAALVHTILAKKYITATEDKLYQYIDHLLSIGFLEFSLPVSGRDLDWAPKLAAYIKSLSSLPICVQLAQDLNALQGLANQYAAADTPAREKLLRQAHGRIKGTYELADKAEANQPEDTIFRRTYNQELWMKPHQIWYEDTVLQGTLTASSQLKDTLTVLGDLLARTGLFDNCLNERDAMTQFFVKQYGEDGHVDLLRFYKEYSRHTRKRKSTFAPASKARQAQQKRALKKLLMQLQLSDEKLPDEVHITTQHIEHLPVAPGWTSFSVFLHAYKENGQTKVAINNTSPGYGKMFSRFLYAFDTDVMHALRRQVKQENVLLAEPVDASVFNGNLHERIMPYEIRTPGAQASLTPEFQLDVHELEVSYNAPERRLILTHTTLKKEVVVFDLELQNPLRRSALYNMLDKFTWGSHHHINPLVKEINEHIKKVAENDITVLPRIAFEDRIILQRKTWKVAKGTIPLRQSNESDWQYFLRLRTWAYGLALPSELFVRQGSYGKPQYISLNNPLLLSVFEAMVRACETELSIQEMLPSSKQLFAVNGGECVTEMLCEWNVA